MKVQLMLTLDQLRVEFLPENDNDSTLLELLDDKKYVNPSEDGYVLNKYRNSAPVTGKTIDIPESVPTKKGKRRKMSKDARVRISAAQKHRWAVLKGKVKQLGKRKSA